MKSRELPRVVTTRDTPDDPEGADESPRTSRLGRLDFALRSRRLDWMRLSIACVLIGISVAIVGSLGRWAIREAVAWLNTQPKYQLAFEEIQLDPPAPAWILGGARSLLGHVRENSGSAETLSLPNIDAKRLTEDFKKSPWVRQVREIRFSYPNRVTVQLDYRRPVGLIEPETRERSFPDSKKLAVLDEDGVILPAAEIDPAIVNLGPPTENRRNWLIRLIRYNKDWPSDRSPGTRWKTSPINSEPTETDLQVYAAAKLAGFLDQKQRATKSPPQTLRIHQIYVNDGDPYKRGLVIYNFEPGRILWGPAPGEEPAGSLSAEDKWAMLREWAQLQPRPTLQSPNTDHWAFKKDGLRAVSASSASR
jgi:hypothetical protein